MKVEITQAKTRVTYKIVEVTEDQLKELEKGINPFHEEIEKEPETIEWDFAVNDLEGNEIIPWC